MRGETSEEMLISIGRKGDNRNQRIHLERGSASMVRSHPEILRRVLL